MALNILITNGCDSRGLKLSSLNEDEQDTARGMSFFYGYSKMHFDGDDYFSVVIDDFSFNCSAIIKLVVEKENYSKGMQSPTKLTPNPTLTTLAAVTSSAGAQNLTRTATSWQ